MQSTLRLCPLAYALALAVLATGASGADKSPAPKAAARPDMKAVAATLVRAGLIAPGDKVQISGSVRDNALLEDLTVETMKAGGQPLVTIWSDQLTRRSFDEVPTSYDSVPQTLGLALVNDFDAGISVEVGESDDIMAGIPAERIAARAAANQPVLDAYLKRGARSVNLGNGLYPTAARANALGMTQPQLAAIFWKASAVAPETIRSKGESLRTVLAGAKQVTVRGANGTQITFGVAADKGFVSDGAITADKVKQGTAAIQTWLPAGELLVPVAAGSAEGTVVIDKLRYQGTTIVGLTMNFSKGVLTSMSAKSGPASMKALQAYYDAATGGKDSFSYIDLGLNPEVKLPTNTGRVIWMGAGAVTVGMGDNTGWGGSNVSTFNLAAPLTNVTVSADDQVVIKSGVLQ